LSVTHTHTPTHIPIQKKEANDQRGGGREGGRGMYLGVLVHQIYVVVHGLVSAELVEAKAPRRPVIARGENTGEDGWGGRKGGREGGREGGMGSCVAWRNPEWKEPDLLRHPPLPSFFPPSLPPCLPASEPKEGDASQINSSCCFPFRSFMSW